MKRIQRGELISILCDVTSRIANGDSFEGFINYVIPMDDDTEPGDLDVEARYRIGNNEGQGGWRMIGVTGA